MPWGDFAPGAVPEVRLFADTFADPLTAPAGALSELDRQIRRLRDTGDASRRHLRPAHVHHRAPRDGSARCRSDQRIGAEESIGIKQALWRDASKHAPAHTVFTTNTSTLAPSAMVDFVDRPEQFLTLHFAIGVWDSNISEVMGHPGTDPAVFSRVLTFAEEIGLVPIPIGKEQNGYIINSLIVPWCTAALDLLVRGVSNVESIDRTWMITLQSGIGPCGMMDRMGLGVVYRIAKLIGEAEPGHPALESARYIDADVHPARPLRGGEWPRLLQLPESGLRSARLPLNLESRSRATNDHAIGAAADSPHLPGQRRGRGERAWPGSGSRATERSRS